MPKEIKLQIPDAHVTGYADDTQSLSQATKTDVSGLVKKAGESVTVARRIFADRGLKMNASKTQVILCGSGPLLSRLNPLPEMVIDGESIVFEETIRDLGVQLDQNMTFTAHVDNLTHQMCWILCYISRIRYSLTEQAARLLVNSLVMSKLSYCSVVWGGIRKTEVMRLQRIVNFAARIIFNRKKHEHVSPLLRQLNWLSVENRLKLDTACFMFKVAHDMVPNTISEMFTRVIEVSQHITRQASNFYIPIMRTQAGRRTLSFRGPKVWTTVPRNLKDSMDQRSFRCAYRQILLQKQNN